MNGHENPELYDPDPAGDDNAIGEAIQRHHEETIRAMESDPAIAAEEDARMLFDTILARAAMIAGDDARSGSRHMSPYDLVTTCSGGQAGRLNEAVWGVYHVRLSQCLAGRAS